MIKKIKLGIYIFLKSIGIDISRIKLFIRWIKQKDSNVRFSEIIKYVFKGDIDYKLLQRVEDGGDDLKYRLILFKDLNRIMYYPKEYDIKSLYYTMAELMAPDNWHYYEIPQTRVTEYDVVADCGASEGLFSLITAARCRKVYAIEPLPQWIDAMKNTFKGVNNVHILPVGLSDREGTAYILEDSVASAINEDTGVKIQISTIDKLFYEKNIPLTYIKADLEGFDVKMLQGAVNTIKKYSPKIAITTYHELDHARLIKELLKNINPKYNIITKGISDKGGPFMLHAWV